MQTDRPYRDEREAALARVDRLERELLRTKRELDRVSGVLARRKRRDWKRAIVGGVGGLALLLVVLLTLGAIIGGCVAGLGHCVPAPIHRASWQSLAELRCSE